MKLNILDLTIVVPIEAARSSVSIAMDRPLISPALTGPLFYLIGQIRLKSRTFSKMQEKQPATIFQMSLRRITIRRIKITSILMTGISQHVKNQLILK